MGTHAQLRAFLDTAGQLRLFAFYRLAEYTGVRPQCSAERAVLGRDR